MINILDIEKTELFLNKFVATSIAKANAERLDISLKILKKYNLTKLIDRLMSQNKIEGFKSTITEVNLARQIIEENFHNKDFSIEYEPDNYGGREIDLKVIKGNYTYWVQVKRLSDIEFDNRINKLVSKIEKDLNNIKVPLFI